MENQNILDSRLIEKFEVHRDFTRLFLDAFVLINSQQKVLKFNSAFCQIIELRAIDIRRIGSLSEMLRTQLPGEETSAIEQIMSVHGPTRIDDVPTVNMINGKELSLIISSYPYYEGEDTLLGACLLLRDVTAETNLQTKYKDKTIESVTDPLTGLYTRRYFEAQIEKELNSCRAKNVSPKLAIIMFDLDKFKKINDTYGHQAGDLVLSDTAKILKSHSRRSDIVGRYGGEELLIVIFDATPHGVAIVSEKFRVEIANYNFMFDGQKIPVTTSVGVTLINSPEDTKELAVKRADECLYHAKESGRNIVIINYGNGLIPVQQYLKSNPEI